MESIGRKFLIRQEKTKSVHQNNNYVDMNYVLMHNRYLQPFADLTDAAVQYVSTSTSSLSKQSSAFSVYLKSISKTVNHCETRLRWILKTDDGHRYAIAGQNINENEDFPGIGGGEFDMLLDVDWFREGDVIYPKPHSRYQLMVMSEPQGQGTYTRYRVKYLTMDPEDFFPPELLFEGFTWCCMGSYVSEASWRGGSLMHHETGESSLIYEVPVSRVSKEVKVTDDADLASHYYVMNACKKGSNADPNQMDTSIPTQIYPYLLAKLEATMNYEKEVALIYGRGASRSTPDPSTGYHIHFGPGLYEYIEDSNVFEYDPEVDTIDTIEEFLQEIFFDRISYKDRNVEILTGQMGLTWLIQQFHAKWQQHPLSMVGDTNYGLREKKGGNSIPGGQYRELETPTAYITRYLLFPTGSITFRHIPLLDSYEYASGLEYNGFPASSYEMIILDYGLDNGEGSNVIMVECPDYRGTTITCGTWSPAGRIRGGQTTKGFTATRSESAYYIHSYDQFGLVIKDVSTMALFRPVFNS